MPEMRRHAWQATGSPHPCTCHALLLRPSFTWAAVLKRPGQKVHAWLQAFALKVLDTMAHVQPSTSSGKRLCLEDIVRDVPVPICGRHAISQVRKIAIHKHADEHSTDASLSNNTEEPFANWLQ